MYKDVILSQRPMFLIAPDEFGGSTQADLAGFTNYTYTSISKKSMAPGGRTTSADLTYSNVFEIGSSNNPSRDFSIDIVSDWWDAAFNYFASDNIYIYVSYDYVVAEIIGNFGGLTNQSITAFAPYYDNLEILHICLNKNKDSLFLVVNGLEGDRVEIPEDFVWSGTNPNITIGSNVSSLAIFNRASSNEEILARHIALRDAQPYSEVCANDGADFWDLSVNTAPVAGEIVLNYEDWNFGTFHNITVDRYNRLTIIPPPRFKSYTKAGAEESGLAIVSSDLYLGADHTASAQISSILSSSNGVLATKTVPGTGVDRILWTLFNEREGHAITVLLDTSSNVKIIEKRISSSGAVTSTTTNTYDDLIHSGTEKNIVVWFLGDYLQMHFNTGATEINQIGGQDLLYLPFNINEETLLILGGDYDYSGTGVDSIKTMHAYNYIPEGITNYESGFYDNNIATAYYTFSYTDGRGRRRGKWSLTTSIPFSGSYEATYVDWKGSPWFSLNDIYISYNSAALTAVDDRGVKIPTVPYAETMGGVGVPLGPLNIEIRLEQFDYAVPVFEELRLVFLSEAKAKSLTSDKKVTYPSTSGFMFRPAYDPWVFRPYGNYRFGASGILAFPSDTYRTIELCVNGTTTGDSELICLNDGTERNVRLNAGTLSQTGFSKVVVNNVLMSGTISVSNNEPLHIIAIASSDVTSGFSIGHHDGTGGVFQGGVMAAAAYDYALSDDTIAEHYYASRGVIKYFPSEIDTSGITDATVEPYMYALAWETTGATT